MTRDTTEILPEPAPDAAAPRGPVSATVDGDHRLWAEFEDRLYRLDPASARGPWVEAPFRPEAGDHTRSVDWYAGHGLWAITDRSVVRLSPDGAVERRFEIGDPYHVVPAPGGGLLVEIGWGGIARIRDDVVEMLYSPAHDRSIGFVVRGDEVWTASTVGLRRWREGVGARDLGADLGISTGGPLAVDREGSVWMGGFQGLFQIPAPDARVWTERDGLPDRHPRNVAIDDEGTRWVVTWRGPGRLGTDGVGSKLPIAITEGEICPDGSGGWWTGGVHTWAAPDGAFLVRMGDPPIWGPSIPTSQYWDCSGDPTGGVWAGTQESLYHLVNGAVTRVAAHQATRVHAALDGTLWIVGAGEICRARAADIAAGGSDWRCAPPPTERWISDLMDIEGEVWATTLGDGAFRWDGAAWSPIASSRLESTQQLLWMSRSPRGGVWVAGHGTAVRAEPDGDGDWRILERLTAADGLPLDVAHHVAEGADGRLHVSTPAGLVEIPAEARRWRGPLPAPELVAARLDGVAAAAGALDVVGADHELEVTFAVSAYRDPGTIRWRVRTSPDRPWSTPTDSPTFRWVGMPYGTSRIEVEVTREGQPWAASAAGPTLVVWRPWYARWWAVTLWSALLLGASWLAYRVRLAMLLRVEQERARIAMDLHDEIGSGLGSISLLAGMAADHEIDEPARRGIAADAARVAQDLGSALGDIVWSLRRDGGSPESLASHLLDRGARMFDPERTTFVVETPPTWPDVELSLPVRREVRRMAVEALNNAAKHAGARRVTMRIQPGRRWTLTVEDDGRGLGAVSPRRGTGLGMDGLRARAERIGADVRWRDRDGGGTIVEIQFDTEGRGRWPWQPGWWS